MKQAIFIGSVQKELAAGTGILDMIGLCKAAQLRPPEFRQERGQFIQTLWRPTASPGAPVEAQEAQSEAQSGAQSGPSRDQVKIMSKCLSDKSLSELMTVVGRTNRTKFRDQVLRPLLDGGLIEMTIPDKPRSSQQKYRLTDKGRSRLSGRGDAATV